MPSFTRAGIARSRPYSTASFPILVDSPPGMISASTFARSSGVRTSIASTPSPRSILTCSITSPWRARTPIVGAPPLCRGSRAVTRLPAARLQQLGLGQLADVEALHRFADALGDPRDHVGILVVRRRFDDCLG